MLYGQIVIHVALSENHICCKKKKTTVKIRKLFDIDLPLTAFTFHTFDPFKALLVNYE